MPLDSTPDTRLGAKHLLSGCGRYWAVVHTHPQAERWATSQLTARGYQVFLPTTAVRRRDRTIPTMFHTVITPLFPRYAFVALSGSWAPVRYTPGVADLLMADGQPARVPDAAVAALQAGEAQRATPAPPGADIAPGDAVTPRVGPFAEQRGVVLRLRGSQAIVGVMMLGHMREVAMQVDCLERRGSDC